jgi:hypothetical protein
MQTEEEDFPIHFHPMLLAGKRKPSMNAIHAKEDL